MPNKNYISRREHEIWGYIQNKEIIDTELLEQIFPDISKNKRNKIIFALCKKGYLNRAQRGLYYNPLILKNPSAIAMRLHEGYLGLSSALQYYNLIEYEVFTIFVMTKNFHNKVALQGTKYELQFIPLKKLCTGFVKKDDIFISTLEKTFFDCFLKPKYVGYSTLTKALYDAQTHIDWKKFIYFFTLTNNSSLSQRTGYILDLLKMHTKMHIPSFVFEFLLENVGNPVKLMPIKGASTFNNKWNVQDNLGKDNIVGWWY